MLEDIEGYFLGKPRRLMTLGRALFGVGAWIIIFGLIGNVATGGVAAIQRLGTTPASPKNLAELYPQFWTWWVPESLLGALPAFLLIALGVWLMLLGRRLLRHYH